MRDIRYFVFITTSFFFTLNSCKSQDIIKTSKELAIIKKNLVNNRSSIELQKKYIDKFQSNSKVFEDMFYNEKSLVFGKEVAYSMELEGIIKIEPNKIGPKLLNIIANHSKNYLNRYNLGGLKYPTLEYMYSYSNNFLLHFKNISKSERQKIIKYLADFETHITYVEYQQVIDKFKTLDPELAESLENARESRLEQDH